MRRKRIVITLNYIKGGGLERVLIDLVNAIYEYCDVTIILIYNIINGDYYNEICKKAKIITIDKGRNKIKNRMLLSIYSRLYEKICIQKYLYKRLLKKISPDVVIAFSEDPTLKLVSSLNYKNKVAWIHTDFLEDSYFQKNNDRDEYKNVLSQYDSVVFVSKALEEKFRRFYALSNTCTICNSVDLSRINALALNDEIERKKNDKIEFISIGRLSFEKGFDRLVRSFSHLSDDEKRKCHLIIVGDGDEFYRLKCQIQQSQLCDVITLVGRRHNPYSLLGRSDVLLSPSRYEGFGLVILEAFALGVPVVATKTVGAIEILDSGKYGILLENNENSFDNIISEIINNHYVIDKYKPLLKERVQSYSYMRFKQEVSNLLLL